MIVNFEVEFDSATGEFTTFGLVDAQRVVKTTGCNVVDTRANAASHLLRHLKRSQPVVGLLLPPPDRKWFLEFNSSSLFTYNDSVLFILELNPLFVLGKPQLSS